MTPLETFLLAVVVALVVSFALQVVLYGGRR
jgi:hypothetical protein